MLSIEGIKDAFINNLFFVVIPRVIISIAILPILVSIRRVIEEFLESVIIIKLVREIVDINKPITKYTTKIAIISIIIMANFTAGTFSTRKLIKRYKYSNEG